MSGISRPDPASDLSAPAIAGAALEVLEREGFERLSFRRVAAELGVSHTTIHRHCGSFDGLLDLCAEQLACGMPDVDPSCPWTKATEIRFTALYEALLAHPGLVVLQRGKPWLGPEMMRRFSEPAVAASLAAGMPIADVIRAHRELYMFTIGCALTYSSYDTRSGRRALAVLDPAEFPALTEHLNEMVDDLPMREAFADGLRHLIQALQPQPTTARTTPRKRR